MAKKNRKRGGQPEPRAAQGVQLGTDEEFKEMEDAGRKGLFGRLNKNLNEAIQQNRGGERVRDAVAESNSGGSADDIAIRRARSVSTGRMVVPEGVIIDGNISGGSETEISGRVEGNVQIDGVLTLAKSALVTGNVRAGSCRVDGLVEGKVECSDEVDLGQGGRVNGDLNGGKRINLGRSGAW